jgi:hypothetical protein
MKQLTVILILVFVCMNFSALEHPAILQKKLNEADNLTKYLKHTNQLQTVKDRDSREYSVGDTRSFWKWDLTNMPPQNILVPATCRAVGEYSYVFVANEDWPTHMNESDVQEVFNYLETETMNGDDFGAVEMDIMHFGELPDELDNDSKLIVFYSELGSFQGSTFDGYFNAYNQMTDEQAQNYGEHSNECEMIYMTCHPLDPTDPIRISVLAHELEHLIHWGGDINEDTWVNEGLAELAMVYFGMPDPISQFNSNPDNSLNTWNQDWADYVKTMLFFTYFMENFDDETIMADIVSEPANSITGIQNQLIEHGYAIPFEAIFNNWTIANYLDDPSVAQGQYNYENLTIPAFSASHTHGAFPASGSGTTNPWAADYIKLFPTDQNFHLYLEVSQPMSIGVIRMSDDVPSTVDFYSTDDVLDIDLPPMTEDFFRMVIVFPNSNNTSLNYSYEITETANSADDELQLAGYNLRNHPNPFNPSTLISFETTNIHENTQIEIYNVKGQKVKQLRITNYESGMNEVVWNGEDENNQPVSSGIYYYKLVVDKKVTASEKMVMLK